MSVKNTSRYSAEELRRRTERGETHTDLNRVKKLSDADVERLVAEDPDEACIPVDWLERAQAVMPEAKVLISLRLDPDVVAYFRSTGPGWQTRINALLRAYKETKAEVGGQAATAPASSPRGSR